MLNKQQILAADDLPRELVQVPEWGGSVYVSTMTGTERDAFEAESVGTEQTPAERLANFRARLLVRTVVDDAGVRMFSDADAAELGKKAAPAIMRLYDVALRLNRLAAKDVDDLSKN